LCAVGHVHGKRGGQQRHPGHPVYYRTLPTASAVSLNTNGSSLADQGESVTNASPVTISVDGKTNMNNCESQMEKGQLAIRFVGIPDSSDGTVLATVTLGKMRQRVSASVSLTNQVIL